MNRVRTHDNPQRPTHEAFASPKVGNLSEETGPGVSTTVGPLTLTWRSDLRQRRRLSSNSGASAPDLGPMSGGSPGAGTDIGYRNGQRSPGTRSPEPVAETDVGTTELPDREPSTTGADAALAARLLQLIAEIQSGLRPAHQSIRWTTAATYTRLCRAHARSASLAARGSCVAQLVVVGVRAQRVSADVVEACGTVMARRSNGGTSIRAIAVCVRRHRGGWWVTAIES